MCHHMIIKIAVWRINYYFSEVELKSVVVRRPQQCHIIVNKWRECSLILVSSSVIYTVLRKLLPSSSTVQEEADNSTPTSTSVVDSVVKAVQRRLDSASSSHSETATATPLTLSDIRSVSDVCSTLSDCLPSTFTEYFIQQACKHLDDMQLFKVSST